MIYFFKTPSKSIIATEAAQQLDDDVLSRLKWLFGDAEVLSDDTLDGFFVGPRREMVTPWSTNAVEITQNMDLTGIERIEEFTVTHDKEPQCDVMLQRIYHTLDGDVAVPSPAEVLLHAEPI